MNLFFLILLVTVFVVACPPIFNDFTFLGNESHTTADLVRDVFNKQPQLSWSEIVTKVRLLLLCVLCVFFGSDELLQLLVPQAPVTSNADLDLLHLSDISS
jgi:hypothetical protein